MKKIVLSTIFLFSILFSNAQSPVFEWAKGFECSASNNYSKSIVVDAFGNVYTTGYFRGTVDFDPGVSTFNLTAIFGVDVFVLKVDVNGNFIWAKDIGGTSSAYSFSIAIDKMNNVYTTGCFYGTVDFDPGVGTYNLTATSGYPYIFISKLDASGNFIWAKSMGENGSNEGYSVDIDTLGNVYSTGYYYQTADFDPGPGVFYLTSPSIQDIFISKLDASGNFVWAKTMGGSSVSDVYGNSIKADMMGNVYTVGYFSDTVDFDPGLGVYNIVTLSGGGAFLLKLNSSGNFVFVKSMETTSIESILVDASNTIYTTGEFSGTVDFDLEAGVYNLTSVPSGDLFIHKLSQTPTGINEYLNEASSFIFPNPSNNYIDIETNLKDYSLSVFDIMGKLIFTDNVSQNKTRMDISNFSNGIYFLQLITGDKIISKKLIKE